jgi:arginine decarboxylase
VDSEGLETSLPIHALQKDKPYLLGIFLLGAYQEILGDMHNLFGDTRSVNVEVTSNGGYRFTDPQRGDTVAEVLSSVHISVADLKRAYRERVAAAELSPQERDRYLAALNEGLSGYTYLEHRLEGTTQ